MEKDLIEEKLISKNVYDGTLLHVKCDTVRLPNGKEATRDFIVHPGASAVVALLPNKNILLVKQYRYPIGEITLEIPAGKLDPFEEPLTCAQRELVEETGYTAEKYTKLFALATTVGFSNEIIHIYLAENLTIGEARPDEDEFIEIVDMPLWKVEELIKEGVIKDAKTVVGILLFARSLVQR